MNQGDPKCLANATEKSKFTFTSRNNLSNTMNSTQWACIHGADTPQRITDHKKKSAGLLNRVTCLLCSELQWRACTFWQGIINYKSGIADFSKNQTEILEWKTVTKIKNPENEYI